MKYRKRIKVIPGVNLNISRRGISTTIGPRGLNVNIGKKGAFLNTGIPGTGLYDRKKLGGGKKGSGAASNEKGPVLNFLTPKGGKAAAFQHKQNHLPLTGTGEELDGAIKSVDVEQITTPGLEEFKKLMLTVREERNSIKKELKRAKNRLRWVKFLQFFMRLLIIGFFLPLLKRKMEKARNEVAETEALLAETVIPMDVDVNEKVFKNADFLKEFYQEVISCEKIWDVTAARYIDKGAARVSAEVAVSRKEVSVNMKKFELVRTTFDSLHLENANGGDLFIFPGFIIVEDKGTLGVMEMKGLEVRFSPHRVIEPGEYPSDAEVVDQTWVRVNKDGSRDKRYKNNYQIPVCKYGLLELSRAEGLQEAWLFSGYKKAEKLAQVLKLFANPA